jgi:hypothetical protein
MTTIFRRPKSKTAKQVLSSGESDAEGKRPRPRLTRVPEEKLPGFRLTKRAIQMVEATYKYRALTPQLYELLFFPKGPIVKGKPKIQANCQRHLRELYHRSFLLRTEQPATLTSSSRPLVYWLDQRGAALIAQHRGIEVPQLDWRPGQYRVGPMHIDHLLDTNRVRISIVLAAQALGWTIAEWRDDLTLKREHAQDEIALRTEQGVKKHRIIPDGYGVLTRAVSAEDEDVMRLVLEVDRSTSTLDSPAGHRDWATKLSLYREYLRPGGLAEQHFGTNAGRVLIVTLGEQRLANLKRLIESQGGRRRYWLTSLERAIRENILSTPIWQVASADGFYSLLDAQ